MKVTYTDGYTNHSDLLTRQQIADIFIKQRQEIREGLCCPHCGDILLRDDQGKMHCNNGYCDVDFIEEGE